MPFHISISSQAFQKERYWIAIGDIPRILDTVITNIIPHQLYKYLVEKKNNNQTNVLINAKNRIMYFPNKIHSNIKKFVIYKDQQH